MYLQGIRVLDLTRLISGPFTTRILADFGAEVIKVQSQKISKGTEDPSHPFFYYLNRNKKSVTLNLEHPDSKELFLKLTEKSDLIVENFSPRVMENWGLSYDVLKERNPKIILLCMSSMGKDGPWSNFVCFSHTFHALSGLTLLTSERLPSPVMIGFSYADIIFGIYGAILALSALISRERTGKGCLIDLSGYEATCSLLGTELLKLTRNKKKKNRGNEYPLNVVFPVGRKRNFCVISIYGAYELNKLAQIVGIRKRVEVERLEKALAFWARSKDPEIVEEALKKKGFKVAAVKTVEDVMSDRTLKEVGFFEEKEGRILIHSPLRKLLEGSFHWNPAPNIGQDNAYVYRDLLGLSSEEMARLVHEGVIY